MLKKLILVFCIAYSVEATRHRTGLRSHKSSKTGKCIICRKVHLTYWFLGQTGNENIDFNDKKAINNKMRLLNEASKLDESDN